MNPPEDPGRAARQRQLLELQARAPLRARKPQDNDHAALALFSEDMEPRLL